MTRSGQSSIVSRQSPMLRSGRQTGPRLTRSATDHGPRTIDIKHFAFTLIELMVVVAILGVIMTIAIPSIYQTLHKDSLRAAVSDVMEICSHARAYSILNGVETGLRIRPGDRQLDVVVFSGGGNSDESTGEPGAV